MAEANFLRQITIDISSNAKTGTEGILDLKLNSIPKECYIAGKSYLVNLYEIVYANEMYSPAHLTVKCHITKPEITKELPSYQDIVNFFLLANVKIEQSEEIALLANVEKEPSEDSALPDDNYYVHEVRPSFEKKKKLGDIVVLYLDIYSADKLITLDKYSKSYVHKRLYNDILSKEVNRINESIGISIETQDYSTRLKYGQNKSEEIFHPYLVQYNEPLYDFLSRTANRMGEFLYFAHGKLTLGVNLIGKATKIEGYTSLSVESCNNSVLSVKGISRNYMSKVHDKSSNDLRYTQPTSNDDYLVVYTKDEFDTWDKEYKPGMRFLPLVFRTLFTKSTLGALLADLVIGQGKDAVFSIMYANAVNKNYNESAIEKVPGKAKDKAVLSGTCREDYIEDWYINANADFYNQIDACEKKMASRAITIRLESNKYNDYHVGQRIEVLSSEYVVTNVKYSEIFDGENVSREYILRALPLLVVEIKTSTHEVSLKLIDEKTGTDENNSAITICCPTALPEERRIRKAAPQTAWVVDSDDPKYQGRVRIRYSWDENKDLIKDASPWIRQAEPAAGKGGGLSFRLYKDDEVMIGYENDNIEQPFVIGALYHGTDGKDKNGEDIVNGAPVGRNKLFQVTHQLSNRSGHKMIISEKNSNVPFWTGIQPGASFISSVITAATGGSTEETGSSLAGGIQFTDKYGIYNVSMSTDQRLITIASPMGNISMSAFTGITISAPRGDISITGKNVSIKAANTLTLESGSNAKNTEFDKNWAEGNYGKAILGYGVGDTLYQGAVGGLANFVSSLFDLSFARHTIECFIAPVDGTLQIKSNRYLLLEAGKGKANIPQKAFTNAEPENKDPNTYNKYYGGNNTAVIMVQHIGLLTDLIGELPKNYIKLLKEVKEARASYEEERNLIASDYFKKCIREKDDAYQNIKNNIAEESFDKKVIFNKSQEHLIKYPKMSAVIKRAETYWATLKALDSFVESSNSSLNNEEKLMWLKIRNNKVLGTAFENAKNVIIRIFADKIVMPNSVQEIDSCLAEMSGIMERYPKMQAITKYLFELRNTGILVEKGDAGPQNTNAIDFTNKEELEEFLSRLNFPGENYFMKPINKMVDDTKKNTNLFTAVYEKMNWGYDRAKYGRILFSDKESSTYYVNEKSIESNPNPNIGRIKEIVNIVYDKEHDERNVVNAHA